MATRRCAAVAWRFVATAAVLVEDAFDEAGCLKLVQLLDPNSEHVAAGVVNLAFVEVVLCDELEDQIPLLVAAGPGFTVGRVAVPVSIGGSGVAVAAVGGAVAGGAVALAVSFIRDEPRVLNLFIDALLERLVEARAFPVRAAA